MPTSTPRTTTRPATSPRPVRRPPIRALLLTLALIAAVLGFAPAPPAAALAIATTPGPVRVILSGRTASVRLTVVSTASVPGSPGTHDVALIGPGIVAVGSSSTPLVTAWTTVPAVRLVPGTWTGRLLDSDGSSRPVVLQVLRQSRVTTWAATAEGHGQVIVVVVLQHYDTARGWTGSKGSPVQVEYLAAGRWSAAGNLTTDATGTGVGHVRIPAGVRQVRVERPQGATVTGTTSTVQQVQVG